MQYKGKKHLCKINTENWAAFLQTFLKNTLGSENLRKRLLYYNSVLTILYRSLLDPARTDANSTFPCNFPKSLEFILQFCLTSFIYFFRNLDPTPT